jgi:YD repeat-containing protein
MRQRVVATTPVTFAYDAAGNRTAMTDGVGSVRYSYDPLSRLTSETRNFSRLGLWESLAVPALKEQGRTAHQITSLLDLQTDGAKAYAYGLAEEIKNELDATVFLPPRHIDEDEDRQGPLVYDSADGDLDSTGHQS